MGFSHVLRLCLQGGGVYVESGTVSFVSCTITGNTATYVRAQLKTSHRPDGKMAQALALILACATANDASINHSRYVPQRPAISHRPDGKMPCPKGKIADILAPTHIRRTPYSPTQGPNVYVSGGIVCSWATTLTGVFGTVTSCLSNPTGDPTGDPTSDPTSDPTGVIIGIIVGVILALALAPVILHRRRPKTPNPQSTSGGA